MRKWKQQKNQETKRKTCFCLCNFVPINSDHLWYKTRKTKLQNKIHFVLTLTLVIYKYKCETKIFIIKPLSSMFFWSKTTAKECLFSYNSIIYVFFSFSILILYFFSVIVVVVVVQVRILIAGFFSLIHYYYYYCYQGHEQGIFVQ